MKKVSLANLLTGLFLLTATGCTTLPGGITTDGSASSSIGADDTKTSDDVSASVDAEVKLSNPLDLVSFENDSFTGDSCDKESQLKSSKGAATRISFKNNSKGNINIYWLNFTGERVPYKKGLAPGSSHPQSTFVTHPWVITDANDQCIGIYTSTKTGSVTLNVDKSVDVAGSSSTSASSPVGDTITVARFKQGLTCLESKGESTSARSLNIMLNAYNNSLATFGAEAAAKAFLSPGISDINKAGC